MTSSPQRIRRRLRFEAAVAMITAVMTVVTLISREWIEELTGWDPDGGDGSLEWLIVAILVVVAVASSLAALADRRRLARA